MIQFILESQIQTIQYFKSLEEFSHHNSSQQLLAASLLVFHHQLRNSHCQVQKHKCNTIFTPAKCPARIIWHLSRRFLLLIKITNTKQVATVRLKVPCNFNPWDMRLDQHKPVLSLNSIRWSILGSLNNSSGVDRMYK